MSSGDPALVVSLGASRHSRSICTSHGHLIGWVNRLSSSRSLRALAALASSLLLWEQGGDPGVVDEVAGSTEGACEEEVQEDATIKSQRKLKAGLDAKTYI